MSLESIKNSRNEALDFTKGMLVVCMVIYHSLNYSTRSELGFLYMAFLPPSFILIAGFLISRVYSPRIEAGDMIVWKRLFIRGGKLLLLFTALNVFASFTRGGAGNEAGGMPYMIRNWWEIYIVGSGRRVAFEVLIPIAYLLLLAPVLLALGQWKKSAVTMVAMAAVLLFAIFESCGIQITNGSLVAAGLVGMVLGRISDQNLDMLGRYLPVTLIMYGVYVALYSTIGQPYLIQLLGAVLASVIFYGLGARVGAQGPIQERLQMLGRYSLLSYIAQIAILQLLSRWFHRLDPASPMFIVLLFTTFMLTLTAIELIDLTRRRSTGVNGVYKMVFA